MLTVPDPGLGTQVGGVRGNYGVADGSLGLCVALFCLHTKDEIFLFENNFVNLQGQGRSALTQALASQNLVSPISLGCSGRPGARPH